MFAVWIQPVVPEQSRRYVTKYTAMSMFSFQKIRAVDDNVVYVNASIWGPKQRVDFITNYDKYFLDESGKIVPDMSKIRL